MAQIADRLRALESYIAALDKKVDGLQRIEERLTPQEKRTNRLLDGLLRSFVVVSGALGGFGRCR